MRKSTKFSYVISRGSCVLVAISQILAASSTPATAASKDETSPSSINSGTAWMLHDATVFYDRNNDGRFDKGEEPSTTTNGKGFYQLKGPKDAVPLTLLGGHHSILGKTFEGVLSTPKYANRITQSTTILHLLIEELIRDSVMPVETKDQFLKIKDEANTILTRALGIDSSIDLATFDPNNDVHLYSVNAALHSVMNDVAIAFEAAYGEAAQTTEAIYHATAKVLAKQIAANSDRMSDYLNFEKGVSSAFFRDVTREVGPEVIALRAGDDFSHDFDDIAYIAAPDISRRAQVAARLVHKHYLEDPAQLYGKWSAFHDESVRIIDDDIHAPATKPAPTLAADALAQDEVPAPATKPVSAPAAGALVRAEAPPQNTRHISPGNNSAKPDKGRQTPAIGRRGPGNATATDTHDRFHIPSTRIIRREVRSSKGGSAPWSEGRTE